MYHSQQFDIDQDNNEHGADPSHRRNLSTATAGNVDRLLYKDLVEIVPLVQSLIDQKANSSYTRRGSMIYTKTPSVSNKMAEAKAKNAQVISGKKRRENGGNEKDGGGDGFSMFLSSEMLTKENEELAELKEKVENLQRQLLEKDEILKSAEASKNDVASVHSMLDQVKKQALEKDVLLRSTQAQLADVKNKLADKQAAVERLQWEAMTSNKKVEKLQEDLNAIQGEMSSYTLLIEGMSNDHFTLSDQEYDVTPQCALFPDIDELDLSKMEKAQESYMVAVADAKVKQDEESIAIAANARLHLQSFVLRN